MRRHTTVAGSMLGGISYLRPALSIPLAHHEHWDGSGYPKGLKGRRIPLQARIFSVVDHYDALSSPRPYRKAWPKSKVIAYLRENSGKVFDPEVVETFLRLHEAGGVWQGYVARPVHGSRLSMTLVPQCSAAYGLSPEANCPHVSPSRRFRPRSSCASWRSGRALIVGRARLTGAFAADEDVRAPRRGRRIGRGGLRRSPAAVHVHRRGQHQQPCHLHHTEAARQHSTIAVKGLGEDARGSQECEHTPEASARRTGPRLKRTSR